MPSALGQAGVTSKKADATDEPFNPAKVVVYCDDYCPEVSLTLCPYDPQ
jgi:hypothetical protein